MVSAGLTLALDAAAGNGTVAVLRDGVCIAERDVVMRSAEEERFFPAILDTLSSVGLSTGDLTRIVAGAGPGSFTALRVVGAIAKGLAAGSGCALYGVPSLALIPAALDTPGAATTYLATLDALRGDRYASLVRLDAAGAVVAVESLGLIPAAALAERAAAAGATLIGPDEATSAAPHARGVARCLAMIADAGPVDLASWEPVYGRLAEAQVKWEATHGRALVAERFQA